MEKTKGKRLYEKPRMMAIEIKSEGMICGSQDPVNKSAPVSVSIEGMTVGDDWGGSDD